MQIHRSRQLLVAMTMVLILVGCSDHFPFDPPGGGDPEPPTSEDPASEDPDANSESPDEPGVGDFEVRSLDGRGNNPDHRRWGQVGRSYARVGEATYGEDGEPVELAVDPRRLSNRIFNDRHQNVHSARGLTQWTWLWGQFIDHTIGLRDGNGEQADLSYDNTDPLEEFVNDTGTISFQRSAFVERRNGHEQRNLVSSFIDAFNVYGGTEQRLEWLRNGPVDGDMSNNEATLLSTDDGFLPTADMRPDAEAPSMELAGRLANAPEGAVIAGDRRANENIALTATQTLFMREHNRIVGELPEDLDEQMKFEIARRVVGAEMQFITYNEFLPAVGVDLPEYEGYDPEVDPRITNEFATVGYRGHSMIHGEFEIEVAPDHYTEDQLAAFEERGIEVEEGAETTLVAVPLNAAFTSPELVPAIGIGPLLAAMGGEPEYENDEMFDNQLRSVLFMKPRDDVEDLAACMDGPALRECFEEGVADLALLDVLRALDHGMPNYNDMRESYGLERNTSFTDVTGEDTDEFPDDPEIDAENPLDDPDILDFVELRDADGNPVEPDPPDEPDGALGEEAADVEAEAETATTFGRGSGDEEPSEDPSEVTSEPPEDEGEGALAVEAVRRTTVASRLKALYGDVDALDPFTGMVSEPHVEGSELGELQHAIWTEQFTALRDGDSFFYLNDPVLEDIEQEYGITFQRTLREVLLDNTDLTPEDLNENVFFAEEE
jgi:hypothetical protein